MVLSKGGGKKMQQNILKESNITKIFLNYTTTAGIKKKLRVKMKYMDNKNCYFFSDIPENFVKPKPRTNCDLVVYTPDGIYKASVKLVDSSLSLNGIMWEVNIPKTWNFVQLRSGTRKNTDLSGSLKFNDGYEISFQTNDLSIGGFSFFSKERIATNYQRFSCICTLNFPKESFINFPDSKLITEAKFVRTKENIEDHLDEFLYGLKFIKLTNDEHLILKNYLLKLE